MFEEKKELKPCPFCGEAGKPFLQSIGNESTKERGADVGCLECGFTKHIRVIRYSCEWALHRAEQAWNTRASEDICGLCGLPGADKMPHPIHWPGEQVPDSEWVHAECEQAECGRAHAALSDRQREEFLKHV